MKIAKPDWYGLDHKAVNTKFSGELSFLNEFCVNGEYSPSAVYHAANPDLGKGHKEFMLLTKSGQDWFVRGMTREEIQKYSTQSAVHCLSCDSVIYSVNRHDFRHCECGNVNIDGGQDYTKIGFKSQDSFKRVVIDLLTDIISDTTNPQV